MRAEIGVRALVGPANPPSTFQGRPRGRRLRFGERVLVFDTETTVDFAQSLLFGFFLVAVDGTVVVEGAIVPPDFAPAERAIIQAALGERWPIMSAETFIEEIFYPEVFDLGALCVGFNLPFDLSRLAIHAACGRGEHRKAFTLTMTRNYWLPRIRIQTISPRAAFIQFVPSSEKARRMFPGRFLDLKTLTAVFTGRSHSLASACEEFKTDPRKTALDEYGVTTAESVKYGRNDVHATFSLYERLSDECRLYSFITFKSEFGQRGKTPPTKLYSAASLGKATLREIDIQPLLSLDSCPAPEELGPWMSAYFGGRADVRVRRMEVPVHVVDFTSMYPSVFIAQNLQNILTAQRLTFTDCTQAVRDLFKTDCAELLADAFRPEFWPSLNCLVKVKPQGELLPVRFRTGKGKPWQIAVTPFTSERPVYYTLADCIAAKILGGKAPRVLGAVEVIPDVQQATVHDIQFRGDVRIDPRQQIFRVIVERRQIAKGSANKRLADALKELSSSAAYGVNAEINTHQLDEDGTLSGPVYGAWTFQSPNIADERPGGFFNPIIAALVTGGARLRLAMLERMVTDLGGTYAFCDTDSLAIVAGDDCPPDVPSLTAAQVQAIIDRFDQLNPYDRAVVPHSLKLEYENVRCFAISAKRYVLFKRGDSGFPMIIKPSESGLGALIDEGHDDSETLVDRIWQLILADAEGRPMDTGRLKVPARRRIPLNRPRLLEPFRNFNRGKDFDDQVKPFGFLQSVTPALELGDAIRPIAPFSKKAEEIRRGPWIDLESGKELRLDWLGSAHAGTVPVQTVEELARQYAGHAEEKAADKNGLQAGRATTGCLHRLPIVGGQPEHLGKEIDRLEEQDGISLDTDEPFIYEATANARLLEWAIAESERYPQATIAGRLGISERALRDIQKGRTQRPRCAAALIRLIEELTRSQDAATRHANQ